MPLSLSTKISAGLPRDAFEVTMYYVSKYIPRSEFTNDWKGRGLGDLGVYSS